MLTSKGFYLYFVFFLTPLLFFTHHCHRHKHAHRRQSPWKSHGLHTTSVQRPQRVFGCISLRSSMSAPKSHLTAAPWFPDLSHAPVCVRHHVCHVVPHPTAPHSRVFVHQTRARELTPGFSHIARSSAECLLARCR